MIFEPENWPHEAQHRCINCGGRIYPKEGEFMEEEKNKMCSICGKPRTRGHHHIGHKKIESVKVQPPANPCPGCRWAPSCFNAKPACFEATV
jgi:hypothetical protein